MQLQKKRVTVIMTGLMLFGINQLASAKEWAFDVYLDKTKIGTHTFTLTEDQRLTSKANFDVKVLFINAYHYQHTAIEQWQGNCLQQLEAHTLENKVKTEVTGSVAQQAFVVSDGKTTQQLPECVMTFAYWNPSILKQSHLLNPQNADYLDTTIQKIDTPKLDVKGQSIETNHYKITGSLKGKPLLNIELWYDTNNDWVGLKSITPDGYQINYKRK